MTVALVNPGANRRRRRTCVLAPEQLTYDDVLTAIAAAARASPALPPPRQPRLDPPARMVELLAAHKRACLRDDGTVTTDDFDRAWARCWEVMVDERAWPHATDLRRQWRTGMRLSRHEYRAAFLSLPAGIAWEQIVSATDTVDQSRAAELRVRTIAASSGTGATIVA